MSDLMFDRATDLYLTKALISFGSEWVTRRDLFDLGELLAEDDGRRFAVERARGTLHTLVDAGLVAERSTISISGTEAGHQVRAVDGQSIERLRQLVAVGEQRWGRQSR